MLNKSKTLSLLILLAILIALPFWASDYFLHVLIISGIWVILVTSLGLIAGHTGQLSFAHAAFMGIGAYCSTLLVMKMNIPFWVAFPVGGLFTSFCGLFIGFVALRTKGPYFAVTTLGFQEILRLIFVNWESLTRGPDGISGIPVPEAIHTPLFMINFESKINYYFLVLVVIFVMYGIFNRILRTKLGKSFVAIREDETLAKALGINTMKYKIISFCISVFFAGLAGSLLVHYTRFISPVSFTIGQSFDAFVMLVVGGSGTLFGPAIGAVLLNVIPEYLHSVNEYRMILYGFILVLVIIFSPGGVYNIQKILFPRMK